MHSGTNWHSATTDSCLGSCAQGHYYALQVDDQVDEWIAGKASGQMGSNGEAEAQEEARRIRIPRVLLEEMTLTLRSGLGSYNSYSHVAS